MLLAYHCQHSSLCLQSEKDGSYDNTIPSCIQNDKITTIRSFNKFKIYNSCIYITLAVYACMYMQHIIHYSGAFCHIHLERKALWKVDWRCKMEVFLVKSKHTVLVGVRNLPTQTLNFLDLYVDVHKIPPTLRPSK